MVRLTRIYTKGGDHGETSLGDGIRVSKDDPRIQAYGTVDELNSIFGLMMAYSDDGEADKTLLSDIQNDLFDLGADLSVPNSKAGANRLRISTQQVERLENQIDIMNEHLPDLESFVLPGGSVIGAWCHLARTVCRRAEREAVSLSKSITINSQVIIYLNRLSDLLFVLSRTFNVKNGNEILWKPGKTQKESGE